MINTLNPQSKPYSLTMTTLLYHGNLKEVLDSNNWYLRYNNDMIKEKLIVVNNVEDRISVEEQLKDLQQIYPKLTYLFVEDYEQQAIDEFKLNINKQSTVGYYYIIPYFVMIQQIKTATVFHISNDCILPSEFPDEYIKDSYEEVLTNPVIPTTTLSWGLPKQSYGYDVGEWEEMEYARIKQIKNGINKKFWCTHCYSDQLFLANISNLKNRDYNRSTRNINIGTPYCPDSFERRLSEDLFHTNSYRGVWKNSEYYYKHISK